MHDRASGITNKDRYLECIRSSNMVLIMIKTSREIEAKYVDFLSVLSENEKVIIGPLVQETFMQR